MKITYTEYLFQALALCVDECEIVIAIAATQVFVVLGVGLRDSKRIFEASGGKKIFAA